MLLIQTALLILGIYALASGRIVINKTRVIMGRPARLLGLLAITPLLAGLGMGFLMIAHIGELDDATQTMLAIVEVGITLGCGVLVFTIGWPLAHDPEIARRLARLEEHEDDDEDEEYAYPGRARPESADEPVEAVALPPIRFPCPQCQGLIKIDAAHEGRKVRCPRCQAIAVAPAAPEISFPRDAISEKTRQPGAGAKRPSRVDDEDERRPRRR